MSEFSVQLPDADRIVSAPVYNPGPSPLNPVLEFMSSGLTQFKNDMDERAKKKKESAEALKEKQENDAKRKLLTDFLAGPQQEAANKPENPYVALFDTAVNNGLNKVKERFVPKEPLETESKQVQDEVTAAIEERKTDLDTAEQAVAQGTMSNASYEAFADKTLLEVVSLFPDVDPDEILDFAGKIGMTKFLNRRYNKRMELMEGLDNTVVDKSKEALGIGMEIYGAEASKYSEEQLIAVGFSEMRRRRQFQLKKEELDLLEQSGRIDEAERKALKEQAADETLIVTQQAALEQLAPLIDSAQKALLLLQDGGGVGSNPALEKEINEIMELMEIRSATIIENFATQAEVASPGSGEGVRKFLRGTLDNLVLTPFKNRDQNFVNLARRLETNLSIKAQDAYPFIQLVRSLGFDLNVMDSLISNLPQETQDRLAKEIAGVAKVNMADLRQRNVAQTQVLDIVAVLQGDATLDSLNVSPEENNKYFGVIRKTTTDLTKQMLAGNFESQGSWLSGMAEIAVKAQQLNRSTPLTSLANAMTSLTSGSNKVFRDLINGKAEDEEKATRVLVGTRAATARTLSALATKPRDFGAYRVVFDETAGDWVLMFDEKKWKDEQKKRIGYSSVSPTGGVGLALPTTFPAQPKPPAEGRMMVSALNAGLTFLVDTSKHDVSAPKGTPLELRKWYAKGELTKAQKTEQKKAKENKGGDGEKFKALTELRDALAQDYSFQAPTRAGPGGVGLNTAGDAVTTGSKGQEVTVLGVPSIEQRFGNNPIKKRVESLSEEKGIPTNISLVLFGHESKFNPKARADAGKGRTAYGVGQVVDKIWDTTSKQRYGKPVAQLSPEENIDLGLWILADNYKKTGNWRDAVSMYHSGKPYDKIGNVSDGNITTKNYVDALLAAAGM